MAAMEVTPTAHVVDVLANVVGRDQPIMKVEKAIELVALMGDDLFKRDDVVFFDPFCKAGEILLGCAIQRCKVKSKKKKLTKKEIFKEIYSSNRYFGLAPDERHHRLSLRTFLGNSLSHKHTHNKIIRDGQYVSEEDGKLNEEKFIKELYSMIDYIAQKSGNKKIVAVGNPPYQENYSNSKSNTGANLIYNLFLNILIESKKIDQFQMVIPSRWFAGGRSNKEFEKFVKEMRNSKKVKTIQDFQDSKKVFPTVDIKGGVCFIHWDSNHQGKTTFISQTDGSQEDIDLSVGKIIVREKMARKIVSKVESTFTDYYSEVAWSWNPYNVASNYFDKNGEDRGVGTIDCLVKNGVRKKIRRSKISKNADSISSFKIVYPKAISTGGVPHRPDQLIILGKDEICTETYMVLKTFKTRKEADDLLKYLQSSFVRFLVSVKKITQDVTKDTWCLVPVLKHKFTSSNDLYKRLKLSKAEIEYIETKVKAWGR